MKTIFTVIKTTLIIFSLLPSQLSNAQTAAENNHPSEAITFQPVPKGPGLLGVFEGRIPCSIVAKQLQLKTDKDCEKLKTRLELYNDAASGQPAVFKLRIVGGGEEKWQDGHSYRLQNLSGKWHYEKGLPGNASATVCVLEPDGIHTKLYLWKGDDNVLFLLDENKAFRTGNDSYSYTFNRIVLVPGK